MLTTSPIAVGSPPARMAPTSTSPVLTPMRTRTRTSTSAETACSVLCMRSAARTARSASSSCAIGAPKRAMISSPTILSSRPPNAVTSATSRSKQRSTRRLTCSGSAPAEIDVNPTRSAMSTVARRRSSTAAPRRWPHSWQNRAPAAVVAPQAGQVMAATLPAAPRGPARTVPAARTRRARPPAAIGHSGSGL